MGQKKQTPMFQCLITIKLLYYILFFSLIRLIQHKTKINE